MKNINPYSTPNTPPKDLAESDVKYAGFWLRVVAALLDGFVILLGSVLLFFVLKLIGIRIPEPDIETMTLLPTIIDLLINWLYYTLLESSGWQATFGKKAVGIKVIDMQGEKISFGRANARYWSKILSVLILMFGFLMVAFTEKKQGLHDWIANTLVVRKD